jgi:signal transduction histidine kinase
VIAVLAVVLLVLSLTVSATFDAQSDRNLDALLTGRAQLARQLARAGVGPQQIVNRVGADGVLASLELRNGTVFGTPPPAGAGVRTTSTELNAPGRVDRARLTLAVDTSLVAGARQTLRRILLVGGLLALGVSAVLVAVAVRLALRPLSSMAALASGIAAGSRGRRLAPTRTDTEIGRTAHAFDEMLDELEGAEARARRAEEQTRAFLADAAHELRTPLAGVQAAAETLLQHRDELSRDQREQLEALLVRETSRAGRLVSDLLAVARLDAGVRPLRAPVDLRGLVDTELDRARLLSPQARLSSAGHAGTVPGDAGQLQGVLRNLLDNARRAAGPTGTVHVALGRVDGSAVLDVIDDGPGVPEPDRERVFDRLVRLDAARSADAGGSGLGLAIARGVARAHGGDLVCLGPSGWSGDPARPGAVFRLSLPAG